MTRCKVVVKMDRNGRMTTKINGRASDVVQTGMALVLALSKSTGYSTRRIIAAISHEVDLYEHNQSKDSPAQKALLAKLMGGGK